jgi:hypothetical protein
MVAFLEQKEIDKGGNVEDGNTRKEGLSLYIETTTTADEKR